MARNLSRLGEHQKKWDMRRTTLVNFVEMENCLLEWSEGAGMFLEKRFFRTRREVQKNLHHRRLLLNKHRHLVQRICFLTVSALSLRLEQPRRWDTRTTTSDSFAEAEPLIARWWDEAGTFQKKLFS